MSKLGSLATKFTWRVLKLAALLGISAFTWVGSFYLVRYSKINYENKEELSTLLFGASSLALVVFSLFIAISAIFGWQAIKEIIRDKVEAAMNAKTKALEYEIKGRTLSILGYMLGEMSLDPNLRVQDWERLKEANQFCQMGYDYLSQVGGPSEFMALNNLVYYSSLEDDQSRSEFLVEKARLLKKRGQKYNAMNLLLTGCGVMLRFGTDEKERNQARRTIEAIVSKGELSAKQRKEAKYYLGL